MGTGLRPLRTFYSTGKTYRTAPTARNLSLTRWRLSRAISYPHCVEKHEAGSALEDLVDWNPIELLAGFWTIAGDCYAMGPSEVATFHCAIASRPPPPPDIRALASSIRTSFTTPKRSVIRDEADV